MPLFVQKDPFILFFFFWHVEMRICPLSLSPAPHFYELRCISPCSSPALAESSAACVSWEGWQRLTHSKSFEKALREGKNKVQK